MNEKGKLLSKEKSIKYVGLENIGQGTGTLEGDINFDPSLIKSNKSTAVNARGFAFETIQVS